MTIRLRAQCGGPGWRGRIRGMAGRTPAGKSCHRRPEVKNPPGSLPADCMMETLARLLLARWRVRRLAVRLGRIVGTDRQPTAHQQRLDVRRTTGEVLEDLRRIPASTL